MNMDERVWLKFSGATGWADRPTRAGVTARPVVSSRGAQQLRISTEPDEHRRLRVAIACLFCMISIDVASAYQERGEAPDAMRCDESALPTGGIAGIGFSEDFESGFAPGSGCGQNGWGCGPGGGFEIVNFAAEPSFGAFSAQDQADGSISGLREIRSPVFALETGVIYADIHISDATNLWQWVAINSSTGYFNTRVSFNITPGGGTIAVLQPPASGPPCTGGTLVATTGTWSPNTTMRIGIEVLPSNQLNVYKDGVQIFSGSDISQTCASGNPAVGISQLTNYNANIGTTSQMTVDNISGPVSANPCETPLPACAADVAPPGGNGVVNIDDLLAVVNTWGQTQNPPGTGPRPAGDCAPPPNGNCLVNIDDLLAVVNGWGTCTVP
jgi:hypothetical protein